MKDIKRNWDHYDSNTKSWQGHTISHYEGDRYTKTAVSYSVKDSLSGINLSVVLRIIICICLIIFVITSVMLPQPRRLTFTEFLKLTNDFSTVGVTANLEDVSQFFDNIELNPSTDIFKWLVAPLNLFLRLLRFTSIVVVSIWNSLCYISYMGQYFFGFSIFGTIPN